MNRNRHSGVLKIHVHTLLSYRILEAEEYVSGYESVHSINKTFITSAHNYRELGILCMVWSLYSCYRVVHFAAIDVS